MKTKRAELEGAGLAVGVAFLTPWARNGVLPLHSAQLWLGYIPTPYPFWVGGSPGRSGIFPADQQVPGVAIVGNSFPGHPPFCILVPGHS